MAFEVVSSSLVNESAKKDWVKRIIVPFQWQGPYSFSSEHSKTDGVICGMNLRDTKMCHSGQNGWSTIFSRKDVEGGESVMGGYQEEHSKWG